jgi:hypothetical protein
MAFEGLSGYFAWHSDALLPLVAVDALRSDVSCRSRRRQQPQFRDNSQNLLDHLPWDCDLGHLEHDVAAVAHHLGADLDQLLLEGCPCRKLGPHILMMQSSQDGAAEYVANGLDSAWDRCILVQG